MALTLEKAEKVKKVDDEIGCEGLGENDPLPLKLTVGKSFKNPLLKRYSISILLFSSSSTSVCIQ